MATERPFAYNTGSPIDGTIQVGDLAVGTPTSGFTNSPTFWNGPDEDLGYVIAAPVSGNTQPTPIFGVFASLGFYRTKTLTDNDFIGLSEYVADKNGTPQIFLSATDASIWLTNNGFWNSYVPIIPSPTPTNTATPASTPTNTPTNTPTPDPTRTPTPTTSGNFSVFSVTYCCDGTTKRWVILPTSTSIGSTIVGTDSKCYIVDSLDPLTPNLVWSGLSYDDCDKCESDYPC